MYTPALRKMVRKLAALLSEVKTNKMFEYEHLNRAKVWKKSNWFYTPFPLVYRGEGCEFTCTSEIHQSSAKVSLNLQEISSQWQTLTFSTRVRGGFRKRI